MKNNLYFWAPLWFPNCSASITSDFFSSLVVSWRGNYTPEDSAIFRPGHSGWCVSRGSRLLTGQNPDPFLSIEAFCEFNASPRFLYWIMMSQLCFAASSVLVKRNFGFDRVWYFSSARLEMNSKKFDSFETNIRFQVPYMSFDIANVFCLIYVTYSNTFST